MHEVGLARRLLAMALERAGQEGARRVRGLTVRVGRSAGVSPSALTAHLALLARGTPAEGARLEVEETEGTEVWLASLEVEA